MQIDDTFLLTLLEQLQGAARPWHSVELLDEALLLDDDKLLFHLELLFDRGYLAHRPADPDGAFAAGAAFSPKGSELRLTAQGHEFAAALLLHARQQAVWRSFMRQRLKSEVGERTDTERSLLGMDDVRVVFRVDGE